VGAEVGLIVGEGVPIDGVRRQTGVNDGQVASGERLLEDAPDSEFVRLDIHDPRPSVLTRRVTHDAVGVF
jgi:hypothetical protein